MSFADDFMNYQPPSFTSVAPNSGGTAKALLGSLPSMLTGPGGMAASLFGSALGGLQSSASSDAQGGNVATTGWGTFNSPFVIGTGSSKIDSRNEGQTPVSLDMTQSGPTGGAKAPLLSGDGMGGFTTILLVGVVGLVLVKAMKAKGA